MLRGTSQSQRHKECIIPLCELPRAVEIIDRMQSGGYQQLGDGRMGSCLMGNGVSVLQNEKVWKSVAQQYDLYVTEPYT